MSIHERSSAVMSRDEEITHLSRQVDGVYRLVEGVLNVLNSLGERLTGEQFTVITGRDDGQSLRRFVPELQRVVWHPVQSQDEVEWPGPDLRDPTTRRSPVPCQVRRALYELPGKSGWQDFGLDPSQSPERKEQVESEIQS
jgi:hypothetical protein